MSAIPDAASEHHGMPRFRSLMAALTKETNFRRLVAFYSVWQFSAQMATPFFAVYMLQRLAMPFWFVTLVTVLSSVCGIWATPFWTRIAQRFGTKPTVWTATVADAFVPLAWLFVEESWAWVVVPIHFSGLLNAALTVGQNELVLKLAPEKNGTPYIATFNAIVGPVGGCAAVFGGYLAGTFGSYSASWGPFTFEGLKVVFLLSFLGRLLSLLILHGVDEPNCERVARVIRVLKRARRRRIARKPIPLRTAA
jgi:MFS family permease